MFRTNELVFLGLIGAVTIGVGVALGTALNAAGIPMLGGLANAVVTAAVLTVGVKGVQKFGSGTILWLVVSTVAIPTLSMGPPGAHKLLVGLVAGLLWDVSLTVTGRTKWGYLVSGAVMMLAVMLGVFGVAVYFDFPAAEKLKSAIVYIVPINFALGMFGTWLGLVIFDRRISRIRFVQTLQQGSAEQGSDTETTDAGRDA